MKILLVDNYDSYTFNLYQLISTLHGPPTVIFNDQLTESHYTDYDIFILSPGPSNPLKNFPSIDIFRNKPVLGVCLGHQGLCLKYGGEIQRSTDIFHGRTSLVKHNQDALFANIPSSFEVVRYHSLEIVNCGEELEEIAWSDEVLMAVKHKTLPFYGVQFHPESIGTQFGDLIVINFLQLAKKFLSKDTIKVSYQTIQTDYSAAYLHELLCSDTSVWLDSSQELPNQVSILVPSPLFTVSHCVASQTTHIQSQVKDDIINSDSDFFATMDNFPFVESDLKFSGGFVGYFGYEMYFESLPKCDWLKKNSPQPDAFFMFADTFLILENQQIIVGALHSGAIDKFNIHLKSQTEAESWIQETISKLSRPIKKSKAESFTEISNIRLDRGTYKEDIVQCFEQLNAGESYELCLTDRFVFEVNQSKCAKSLYDKLRSKNPAPFGCLLLSPEFSVLSSSPERFMRIENGIVEMKPMKGTLARIKGEEEKRINMLKNDEKERAENMMIVDLIRNDLGKVCKVGSVKVPKLIQVETFEKVHQLVSTIQGELEVSPLVAIRHCFPPGSMTGAPKLNSVKILNGIERKPRGIYSGILGYFSLNGITDFSVVIRTAVIAGTQGIIGAGGAITVLSEVESEIEEMISKARSVLDCFTHESQ